MKYIYLLTFLTLNLSSVLAQYTQFLTAWISPNTGSGTTPVSAVDMKANSTSTDFFHLGKKNNGSNNDMVLARINNAGATQWEINYDSGAEDQPVCIAVDNGGNVYCFLNSSVSGVMKVRVLKYNGSGTLQWNNVYGGVAGLTVTHGTVDGNANVYFTGYYAQSASQTNFSTTKLNLAGTTLWTQNYNASGLNDRAKYVAVDASSNVYIAGFSTNASTGADWTLLKYNSAGTQQWVSSYAGAGSSSDTALVVQLDPSNNILVAGRIGSQSYLRKYNASGSVLFTSSSLGYPAANSKPIIQCDNAGNIFSAVSGLFTAGAGNAIVYLKKFSSTGTLNWQVNYEGAANTSYYGIQNRAKALLIDEDSSYVYCGIQGAAPYANGQSAQIYQGMLVARFRTDTGSYDVNDDKGFHCWSTASTIHVTGMFFADNKQSIVIGGDHHDSGTNSGNTNVSKLRTVKFGAYSPIFVAHQPSYNGGSSKIQLCGLEASGVADSVQFNPSPVLPGYSYYWVSNSANEDYQTEFITNRNDPYSFITPPAVLNAQYKLRITDPFGNVFYSKILYVNRISPNNTTLTASGPLSFCPGGSVQLSIAPSSSLPTAYGLAEMTSVTTGNSLQSYCGTQFGCADPISYTATATDGYYAWFWYDPVPNNYLNVYSGYNYSGSGFTGNCLYYTDTVYVSVQNPVIDLGADIMACTGDNISLSPGAGYASYSWNTGSTQSSISPNTSGTYSVTVTDAQGCTAFDDINVSFNPLPTVNAGSNQSVCTGSSASLNASGAITYFWDNGLGYGAAQSVFPTTTTTYTVTGTDINGCQNTDQVTITVNALPNVQTNANFGICAGSSTSLSASGASSYSWSPGGATGSSITISPASTTTYTVTGTDANGCQNTDQVTVTVNSNPILSSNSTPENCGMSDGVAGVTISNGTAPYAYLWGTGSTGTNLYNVPSGLYPLTITDGNGCTAQLNVVVNSIGGPVVQLNTTPVNCPGDANGSISTFVSGGTTPYSYQWSTGSASTGISGLTEGNYSVTVTDASGCQTTEIYAMSAQFPLPTINITGGTTFCVGETALLQASGASSYVWSTGGTNAQESVVINAPVTVTVTGTSVNGCSNSSQISITANPNPVLNTQSTNSVCESSFNGMASVAPSGGTGPYQISWSTGENTNVISNLAPGNYSVIVTDANNCATSEIIAIAYDYNNPSLDLGPDTTLCNGETLELIGTSGMTSYLWSDGSTESNLIVDQAGIYSLSITDNNGCSASDDIAVTYTECLGISENQLEIAVYPNPVQDMIHVQSPVEVRAFTLYDAAGRKVFGAEVNTISFTISMEDRESGWYALHLDTARGPAVISILK